MIPFELPVVDAGLIFGHSQYRDRFLPFGEPLSFGGIGRRAQQKDKSPENGCRAEDDEWELPGRNTSVDRANSVSDESTKDIGQAVHREPYASSEGLFAPESYEREYTIW